MKLLKEAASLKTTSWAKGAREAIMIARHPNLLKKGMLFKWKRHARQQKWHLLPLNIAKLHKEVPNWLRESLGLKMKGKPAADDMPLELLAKFDKALCSRLHGLQAQQEESNELLTSRSMIKLMKSLVARYNANVVKNNIEITRQNKELFDAFKAGEVSAKEASEGKKELQKEAFYVYIYTHINVLKQKHIYEYTYIKTYTCIFT